MVMLWLFTVLIVIAAATIITVLVVDRRSGLGPSIGAPERSGPSWSRRRNEQVVELPRRLANLASLFQLLVVRKRIRAQRWLHALLTVPPVSGLMSAAAIAGRSVRVTERSDTLANRNIVLCLDVSTSMVRIDSSVLTTFSEILEDLDGERVGIVTWNSAAQTIVSLTDDYELLRNQLSELGDVLDTGPESVTYKQQLAYQEAFGGMVSSNINGSSLTGDGLTSCARAFDNQDLGRSRFIILVADSQVIDPDNKQTYPLPGVAKFLTERKVCLFSIYDVDEDQPYRDLLDKTPEKPHEELKTITEEQGKGRFYDAEDSGAGGQIVRRLEETEISTLRGREQTRRTDIPQRLVITLSLILLGYLGPTTWRRAWSQFRSLRTSRSSRSSGGSSSSSLWPS